MIKLIMSDLDGTLLDDHGQLPAGFDEVMAELQARHVVFAPASGRQYYTLRRTFDKYADDFLFLAENGSYVVYHDTEIFSKTLAPATVQLVLEKARTLEAQDIHIVVCGKKSAYISSHDPDFVQEVEKYYVQCAFVADFNAIEDEILKIAFCDMKNQQAEQTIYPVLLALQNQAQIVLSAKIWVDVMVKEINKGVAIRQVQQILRLRPEECAVFGDYLNDIEMMRAASYSYAMDNAQPAVKQAARFLAPSNRDGGVLQVIRGLIKQKLI